MYAGAHILPCINELFAWTDTFLENEMYFIVIYFKKVLAWNVTKLK